MIDDLWAVLTGKAKRVRAQAKLNWDLRCENDNLKDELYHNQRQLAKRIELALQAIERVAALSLANDKNFVTSEFDPARKAESETLGAQAIRRIEAEHLARQHTEGKL